MAHLKEMDFIKVEHSNNWIRAHDKLNQENAELKVENERLKGTLELIAVSKRPDGTYNRCREACEQIAKVALKGDL